MSYQLLQQIIEGRRHRHYDRTVKMAEWARSMMTGQGEPHKKQVTRFRRFEKTQKKDRRAEVYNPLTKYVLSKVRRYFQKVDSITANTTIRVDDRYSERAPEISRKIEGFAENQTLQNWVIQRAEYLIAYDPNAWFVFDRENEVNIEGLIVSASITPIVARSIDSLWFDRTHKGVRSFCFRQTRIETLPDGKDVVMEDYYLFVPGAVFMAKEVQPDDTIAVSIKGRKFKFETVDNGTRSVPAICVGSYFDEETEMETFVPWFHPAEHVLNDLIRDKSLLDMQKVIHAYYRRYEYVKPCSGRSDTMGECMGGYYGGVRDKSHICERCNGDGIESNFNSEQDVLLLRLPQKSDQMYDLDRLAHTESLDTNILKVYDDAVKQNEERVVEAIISKGIINSGPRINAGDITATQVFFQQNDVWDLVEPFLKKVSEIIEKAITIQADYLEIQLVDNDHRFVKDRSFQTVEELLQNLTNAKNAGAGFDVVQMLQQMIVAKLGEDNPVEVQRMLTRMYWHPFPDKSAEEIVVIITELSENDPRRILYENFVPIFQEIEYENQYPNEFYTLERTAQKKVLDAKIKQYAAQKSETDPTTNEPEPVEPEEDESV